MNESTKTLEESLPASDEEAIEGRHPTCEKSHLVVTSPLC